MGVVGWVVLGIVLAIVASIYAAYRSWLKGADAQAILATRETGQLAIADATEGAVVRIVGTAKLAEGALEAPLSRRPCLCWRVDVHHYDPGGPDWPARTTRVIEECEATDFVVVDESGRALVRGGGAHVVVDADEHYGDGAIENEATTPELEAFLDRWGQTVGDRQLRYAEAIVAEGDQVQVVGRGSWEPDPDPAAAAGDYRSKAMRLVVEGTEEEPVAITKPATDER